MSIREEISMKNRFMIIGLSLVIAVALAIPALAGSPDLASKSASVQTTAKQALKKAKKANKRLNALNIATVLNAVVASNGSLIRGSTGVTSTQLGTGLYRVGFGRDLTKCAWVTSIGNGAAVPVPPGETHSSLEPGSTTSILQQISNSNGVLADRPFQVIVTC
jgi:hypothetical protein